MKSVSTVLALVLSCTTILFSTTSPVKAEAKNYLQTESFINFLNTMEKDHGFERFELIELFSDVKQQPGIIKSISRPAEKALTWAQYRPIFLTPKGIAKGVDFYNLHRDTLLKAAKEFGVPAEVIVAIIGVETRYGVHRGKHRVIDALATLAFDYPRRSKFFTKELSEFLLLCKEAGLNPKAVRGSYAGAMGYPQFISSSYRAYAVDFDKDGKTDLIDNPVDAIGSVANYFKRHGWKPNETVVTFADYTATAKNSKASATDALKDIANQGLTPKFTVAQMQAAGLVSRSKINMQADATAWQVEGSDGEEFWIGMHNFYVITRYNRSHMYAMAVHQLSQEVAAAYAAKQTDTTSQ